MTLTQQIAKHFREAHYGGNWTGSNLTEHLKDITWEQATTKVQSFNTIAALVFHINYYVSAVLKVLEGHPLNASDKLSFDLPPVNSQQDWERLLHKFWTDADRLALLVEALPEKKLNDDFDNGKYGNYYRNLQGLVEHTHYHLGQIALIRKLLKQV